MDEFKNRLMRIPRKLKDVFIDAPNERGKKMMEHERNRNKKLMEKTGLIDRQGNVTPSSRPDLFENPIKAGLNRVKKTPEKKPSNLPGTGRMDDFINRMTKARK